MTKIQKAHCWYDWLANVRKPTTTLGVAKLKRLIILTSESKKIVFLNSRIIEGYSLSISIMNNRLDLILFSCFLFYLLFSILFIYYLLFIIFQYLGKKCDMRSYIMITQVTKCDKSMISVIE